MVRDEEVKSGREERARRRVVRRERPRRDAPESRLLWQDEGRPGERELFRAREPDDDVELFGRDDWRPRGWSQDREPGWM